MTIHLSDLSESARTLLREQTIELPSWAFGNSGTRFKVFPSPGTPRNAYEKIDDAAQVHRFTGITPRVSLHIPWDMVDDFSDLAEHARSLGIILGTINSNVFQDDDYKFGSLTNSDEAIRRKAIDAHLRCIDVMNATGSDTLKIWLGDGTNYPGQDSIAARQERLADSLSVIYENLAPHQRLLLEYKFFEPAFYHTDVPDWGTALAHVTALGERAVVCLDTGHHAPGTNIEFIVVQLLRAGRLGAFDFNSRFYADDDLIVGASVHVGIGDLPLGSGIDESIGVVGDLVSRGLGTTRLVENRVLVRVLRRIIDDESAAVDSPVACVLVPLVIWIQARMDQ